jgi:hypothetical protein
VGRRASFVAAYEPVAECPRDPLEFLHLALDLFSEAQALLAQIGLLTNGPRFCLLDHQAFDLLRSKHADAGPIGHLSLADLL